MALIFEYEKDLETGAQPFICHEPDSVLYNYYISSQLAKDKNGTALDGEYHSIEFMDEASHLTQKMVSKIGVKNFPGIGGIGFFKDKIRGVYNIAVPIHDAGRKYMSPPSISMEDNGATLTFTITPPNDIVYICYRIILYNNGFTEEYITYDLELTVDKPNVIGNYQIYCIGYVNEGEYTSSNSNILTLNVAAGRDSFEPVPEESFYTMAELNQMINEIALPRLNALEAEIANYNDEEIHTSIQEVIKNPVKEEVNENG